MRPPPGERRADLGSGDPGDDAEPQGVETATDQEQEDHQQEQNHAPMVPLYEGRRPDQHDYGNDHREHAGDQEAGDQRERRFAGMLCRRFLAGRPESVDPQSVWSHIPLLRLEIAMLEPEQASGDPKRRGYDPYRPELSPSGHQPLAMLGSLHVRHQRISIQYASASELS